MNDNDTSSQSLGATSHMPIAVVGVSALFAGSADATSFWQNILAGRDLIGDVPTSHWLIDDYYDADPKAADKTYCKRGSFLDPVDFDPLLHGVPPSVMPATDTSQLLALIVARQVLKDAAQGQFSEMDRSRMSVILGVTSGQELLSTMASRLQRPVWVKALRDAGIAENKLEEICDRIAGHYQPWQESSFPGLLGNVVAGRIANRLDLGGTNCVVDAACASTFSALAMAVNELQLGKSDVVISGGVDTLNDIFMFMCFSKTPALSHSGDCRPFSDQADGTLLGEGLCMVALKRLADAERDGDRIYAVIRGLGASSDGRAKSVYAPLPRGQAKALRRAYEAAGFGPESIDLIEAHGTATVAGDAAELEGLRLAFEGSNRSDKQWCALGSVKSQIGHTKAASGAAGLFKAVMALHHQILPPTIKVDRPNPALELDQSPFYVNTRARPWVSPPERPRRAGVSSFGFGGSNFHVALEEYRGASPPAWRLRTAPTELVLFAAESPQQLADLLRQTEIGSISLARLARDSQQCPPENALARLAIVASDNDDLRAKIALAAGQIEKAGKTGFTTPSDARGGAVHYGFDQRPGQVAFLFPGQGSQYLHMGADLAMGTALARSAWDSAARLDLGDDPPLHDVVFAKPVFSDEDREAQQAKLVRTEWAQPAIGAVSLAQLAVLEALGIEPDCVGGHSYGEVTALCAAGVMDAQTMLQVARKRGELMAEAAATTSGAMTAVVAPVEEVRPIAEAVSPELVIANHNSPRQVVLSGPTEAIERAEQRLRDEGLSFKRLAVATAFHSGLVSASSQPFAALLETLALRSPQIPVYANTTAAAYPADVAAVRRTLSEQIAFPVRFVEQIEAMYDAGVRTFVEVGPARVLSQLVGRILDGRAHRAVAIDDKNKHGISALQHALGRLVVAGVAVDLSPLWAPYAPLQDKAAEPPPKPSLQLAISGSNYGKRYPPAESEGGSSEQPTLDGAPERPTPNTVSEVIVKETSKQVSAASSGNGIDNGKSGNGAAHSPTAFIAAPPVQVPSAQQMAPAPSGLGQVASPATPLAVQPGWASVLQEAQRQTCAAHCAFQNAMAQAHMSYLQASERTHNALVTMLSGGVVQAPVMAASPAVSASFVPQPMPLPTPAVPLVVAPAPAAAAPIYVPAAHQPQTPVHAPAPVVAQAPAPQPAATPPPVTPQPAAPPPATPPPASTPQEPAPAAPVAALDMKALLLAVVADKTGYPAEMLSLDMALEADLGIDSIKRVEILSGMREQAPDLPEVDTQQMARLGTLGEIVAYMDASLGDAGSVGAPAEEPPRPKASSAVSV